MRSSAPAVALQWLCHTPSPLTALFCARSRCVRFDLREVVVAAPSEDLLLGLSPSQSQRRRHVRPLPRSAAIGRLCHALLSFR